MSSSKIKATKNLLKAYLKLEFRIFQHIVNILEECKNEYELLNTLKTKQRFIILQVIYDFEMSEKNATKHIMNIFHKNFSKESLYHTINKLLTEMTQYTNEQRKFNSITINKILRNEIGYFF